MCVCVCVCVLYAQRVVRSLGMDVDGKSSQESLLHLFCYARNTRPAGNFCVRISDIALICARISEF